MPKALHTKEHKKFKEKFNEPLRKFDAELSEEDVNTKDIGKEIIRDKKFAKLLDNRDFMKDIYRYRDKTEFKANVITEGRNGEDYNQREVDKVNSLSKKNTLASTFCMVQKNKKLFEQAIKLEKADKVKSR